MDVRIACYVQLMAYIAVFWYESRITCVGGACTDIKNSSYCADAVVTNKCLTSKDTIRNCEATCASTTTCGGTINDILGMCRLFNDSEICGSMKPMCSGTCQLKTTVFCDVNLFPNSYFKAEMGNVINDTVATYGTSVIINCNDGYQDALPVRMACDSTGNWVFETNFGTSLDCKKMACNNPAILASNHSHPNTTDGAHFGDVVDFACDFGYNLTGGSIGRHQCNFTGRKVEWNPFEETGEMPICTEIQCLKPPAVEGAIFSPDGVEFYYNDSVIYKCNDPYIKNNGGSGRIKCNERGLWERYATSETLPMCKQPCQEPPNITNMHHNGSFPYFAGTVVEYICDEGYEKTSGGDTFRECRNESLDWDITNMPMCTGIICDSVPKVLGAIPNISDYPPRYPIFIDFRCSYGYNMTGGSLGRKHCDESGSWVSDPMMGELPTCTRIICTPPSTIVTVPNAHPNQSEPFFTGDVVIYICNQGYREKSPASNKATQSCNTFGQWELLPGSGEYPNCTKIIIQIDMPIYKKFVPNIVEASGSWIFGLVGYLCILFVIVFLLLMDAPLYYRHIRYLFCRNIRNFFSCSKTDGVEIIASSNDDGTTASSSV